MASVTLLALDGREFAVTTAEALVWAVYGRGAQPKTGTVAENLDLLSDGGPEPLPNGMRFVNSLELADPTSLAAESVREGLEAAPNVSPAGSWNFLSPPMVNGAPVGGGLTAEQTTKLNNAATTDDVTAAVATRVPAFADPAADRLMGWDDSADAWVPVSVSTGILWSSTNVLTVVAASETTSGRVELATAAETTTGTDTTRAVHPAGLKVELDKKAATSHTHVATTDLTATGTKDETTFLRGDNTWAAPPTGSAPADASETVKGVVELATAAETTTGTDATRAVHPAGLKVELDKKAATTHTHGVTSLTATGTRDGTTVLYGDNTWKVPPAGGGGWAAVDASETVKGIVELATTAEATTGTDTVRAVTPAGVKAVADTKAPTTHTHTAANISDSTATGRSVLTAADATAARTAIGAGTSSLAIGTTSTTAKAGDYVPPIDQAAATASMRTLGTGATQAAAGNDARLSDARTPTAHTHPATAISDSTTVGRSILTAADAAAVRAASGAGRVDSSDGTVLNIVKLTQAAYDALGTKVATTLYVIVG